MKQNASAFHLKLLCCFVLTLSSAKQLLIAQQQKAYVENPVTYVNPFHGTAPLTDPDFIGYTPPDGWRVWAGLPIPVQRFPMRWCS